MSTKPHAAKRRRTCVKTGCRTCKIRKVKCDEGRPACFRCVSTGRTCEGYGIWGGGGNHYGHGQPKAVLVNSVVCHHLPRASAAPALRTQNEKLYFDWFFQRASKKLPGAFVLSIWDTLLFQACMTEPAVLHATLTLSAIHRSYVPPSTGTLVEQEQFMLQHYSKAIHHLAPHFSSNDRESVRIALITCFIFTSMEFLWGHFKTAQAHLSNGINILRESFAVTSSPNGCVTPNGTSSLTDDWIIQAFSRLHLQVELFRSTYAHTPMVLPSSPLAPRPPTFRSVNQAWQNLEPLFHHIFHLSSQARRQHPARITNPTLNTHSSLRAEQRRIHTHLADWLALYTSSLPYLHAHQDTRGQSCRLLSEYHTMAGIMCSAALHPHDPCVYDAHTASFFSILQQSLDMRNASPRTAPLHAQSVDSLHVDLSHSLADIGWIPPLYYTALKCRVPKIRRLAVRLLECVSHREGIWDSCVTASVAKKVVDIEVGLAGGDVDEEEEEIDLDSMPPLSDVAGMQLLPEGSRLSEIRIVLEDGEAENVLVEYRRAVSREWERVWVRVRSQAQPS